jgi:hypothetical protein
MHGCLSVASGHLSAIVFADTDPQGRIGDLEAELRDLAATRP